MGNRAVITTKKMDIGVYLHWNGGRDSVEAFLRYCKEKHYRKPEVDSYGWARLCQVIGNFFGGTNSVGIGKVEELDCNNFDNGLYIIENWEIVGRKYFSGVEQDDYDLQEMLIAIDERQPLAEQLGEDYLTAKEYTPEELSIGDTVYIYDNLDDRVERYPIIGCVSDEFREKSYWLIDRFGDENPAKNKNNWVCLYSPTVKTLKKSKKVGD